MVAFATPIVWFIYPPLNQNELNCCVAHRPTRNSTVLILACKFKSSANFDSEGVCKATHFLHFAKPTVWFITHDSQLFTQTHTHTHTHTHWANKPTIMIELCPRLNECLGHKKKLADSTISTRQTNRQNVGRGVVGMRPWF